MLEFGCDEYVLPSQGCVPTLYDPERKFSFRQIQVVTVSEAAAVKRVTNSFHPGLDCLEFTVEHGGSMIVLI